MILDQYFIIVYVDDILIASKNKQSISTFKELHNNEFQLKDIRYLKFFLDLEVARSSKGISLF